MFGLGGDAMAMAGTRLLMHNREFSVGGGPLEVISKLPKRGQLEKALERRLFEKRPDGAILVDNGEINLRLSSLLHFFGVPVVYFIPPKVWVWRSRRIEDLAQHVSLVLSILPFEEPLYRDWGIPFQYVGNPLVDEISTSDSEALSRQRLGFASDASIVTVLPGSRHNEVRSHVEIFAAALRRFVQKLPEGCARPVVAIPVAQAIEKDEVQAAFGSRLHGAGIEVRTFKDQSFPVSHDCLRVARAAIVKSGTSTLESAVIGTPMVLAYATSRSARFVFDHIIRYRGFVGLVNLFLVEPAESALGWAEPKPSVVPELILELCTPENIAAELAKIYVDGPDRDRMKIALSRTRKKLMPPSDQGESPTQAAARAVIKVVRGKSSPVGLYLGEGAE